MKVTIPSWQAYEYVEVFRILKWKDGCIYKTKSIGFAHGSRPKQENESYAPLSHRMTKGDYIVFELMED